MSTTQLAAVGLKAIEYMEAVKARQDAAANFGEACRQWKQESDADFIPRGTPEWGEMLAGVAAPLASVKRAKSQERNARERLFRAIRRVA